VPHGSISCGGNTNAKSFFQVSKHFVHNFHFCAKAMPFW
jgi:hypothetical protein